jgi:nickel/cobalt exporter
MTDTVFYLASSFWLGAVHAATPGHGKTISAAYIVGARGRPVDALVLGIFVTLSHTSGIILVGILAALGSAWLMPHRVEAYLGLGTGLLVIGIGLWMLRTHLAVVSVAVEHGHAHDLEHDHELHHAHDHQHAVHGHVHAHEPDGAYHSHGWGRRHSHRLDLDATNRPQLPILVALGIAGGLLPDPGALAILLAAVASGKVVLGLFTVVVFSLGFASVLVVVGVVAARVGAVVLTWLGGRWVGWLQIGAALLIVGIGIVLTAGAARDVVALG